MAITTARPESSWAFPESYAADNSGNECSSNGGFSREVHLDIANHFVAVFGKSKGLHLLHCAHISYIKCVLQVHLCICHYYTAAGDGKVKVLEDRVEKELPISSASILVFATGASEFSPMGFAERQSNVFQGK